MRSTRLAGFLPALALAAGRLATAAGPASADLSGFRPDFGIEAARSGHLLTLDWPIAGGESGRLVLDLRPDAPLIDRIAIRAAGAADAEVVRGADPVAFVTVGTRVGEAGRPPGMDPFNAFFDAPARRPHRTHAAMIGREWARVTRSGRAATIAVGPLAAGPFAGELRLTAFGGDRLVLVEVVARTDQRDCAYFYDAGLASKAPSWGRFEWLDAEGRAVAEAADPAAPDRPIAVRHRAIAAGSAGGSIACMPPPHRFFFARDLTDNLRTAWLGAGHRGLDPRPGFGVRQEAAGGGSYAPWYNAPAGSEQRMGAFYVLSRGAPADALAAARAYTRGDRFADVPGRVTFTSHWHLAATEAAARARARGEAPSTPEFASIFKGMNVGIVHLAEFHGDGHPADPGPVRLPEMDAMFAECRRLSDEKLLILPGEEANAPVGPPGTRAGHWLYLFPRPVAWTMTRSEGQPFAEEAPGGGVVYHVGSGAEMSRLIEAERGLAWTAHPRIKGSAWTPDAHVSADFFRAPSWLGAAWKAMPIDLSRDQVGLRALGLLDDLSNRGLRKQLVGEVDVFKVDRTHELYAHMNINYLELDRIPRFDESWQPVLDALRGGRFTTTTGEVLIRSFTVAGAPSGASIPPPDGPTEVRLDLEWTFPMSFVEVISGDGQRVYRDRLDLRETAPFGRRGFTLHPDLRGRTWARAEAWDAAGDGAFTQPVWVGAKGP